MIALSCKDESAKVVVDSEPIQTKISETKTVIETSEETALGENVNARLVVDEEEKTSILKKEIVKEVKKENEAAPIKKPVEKKPVVKKVVKKPNILFKQTIQDFGTITEGDVVDFEFHFVNTGDAPLEILSASGSCGCAQPSFPFLEIPPGGENKIGVQFNSVNKEGDQSPEIYVTTNIDPKQKIKLLLTGTVELTPERQAARKKEFARQRKAIQDAVAARDKRKKEEAEALAKAKADSLKLIKKDSIVGGSDN